MSKLIDVLSEYLARRKGLLPLIGIVLIVLNLGLQIIVPGMWLASSNLFLHFGLIIAILGLMLAWAL
jgi:hypothetical protein